MGSLRQVYITGIRLTVVSQLPAAGHGAGMHALSSTDVRRWWIRTS